MRASSALARIVTGARRLVVLTGAGCSTESGIPDYRDEMGEWKRKPPLRFAEFLGAERARKRYWARSLVGFRLVEAARPNAAHHAIARLEAMGRARAVITQNVDGLHQKAGSRAVVDLHGRVDRVKCLGCGASATRVAFQERLRDENPWLDAQAERGAAAAPDGDADVAGVDYGRVVVPACERCGGVLKPDVVFFGESVPRDVVARSMALVDGADALLVAGSSLMIWSGYRFVKRAVARGIPVAAVNLGKTRADHELDVKVEAPCGAVLDSLVGAIESSSLALAASSGAPSGKPRPVIGPRTPDRTGRTSGS